ncbi:hypothetical protein PANDA_007759, partial [Ailuropoda melanoleuca]
VRDFNTPLTSMDRLFKQKISKETMALNDTLDQMDLTDIFRTLHPETAEYTFFSGAHGTFSRIDHTLAHKDRLNKFKKIKLIPCIFSDHNGMKLEVNHKKKTGKNTNAWRLNCMLINNGPNNKSKKKL